MLTGDFPNEFLVDYHAETYGGRVLPRPATGPGALRSALVKGLETSHREVGPFSAWGLPVVQPYGVVVDNYLALPSALLSVTIAKSV